MDYSFYAGVTAYIRQATATEDAVRVLAEAIPSLRPHTDMSKPVPERYLLFMQSKRFLELKAQNDIYSTANHQFPIDTPADYQSASVTHAVYKDAALSRLYIPALSFDKHRTQFITENGLLPVLHNLFGSNLVCVKSRSIDESGYFAEAPERLLVSATGNKTLSLV